MKQLCVMINGEPRYFSKVRGWVKDIDDPKKMRRIRVVVPAIHRTEPLPWALPCDAVRGDWLPKAGDSIQTADIVWVEFEGGYVDQPIWSGLAVAKDDVDSDFSAAYGHEYQKIRDLNGNEIELTKDQSSQGAEAVLINGMKRLATEDHLEWIKSNLLDWLKTTLIGWLKTIQCTGNLGAPAPLFPSVLLQMTTTIEPGFATKISDYETKRAAGGDNLTDKTKAG